MDDLVGVGPRGKRIYIQRTNSLNESYSMVTFMTTPGRAIPFVASMRQGSYTQYDFALFIADCVKNGYLKAGDVLILDNASVHVGNATFKLILDTLDELDVTVFLLPTYWIQ
jgi:hypothetical protein